MSDEEIQMIDCDCGHMEEASFYATFCAPGLCGDCSDEAIDRVQDRQITIAEEL